ncbi:hypothetical protein [Streptomyces purpurogeneiscleroticus]|uniref:hypothetical protein n=1 Tax=Streptomyces purpurogeneiscleroticus TaxID=68259 RepID=UPI001CC09681|nr:hypothetical protein [Streptomyces purpurogeneiscleroticus]MBZ4016266.1 hypothetical protein [Streptomyces purpurogeneiscleroticus]
MTLPLPSGAADVPAEYALLAVDMKEYSKIPEDKMAPVRTDLDDILTTVFAQSGITDFAELENGYKDRGDGAVYVLDRRHTARLVDPFLSHLHHALERYDRTRLESAPQLRLRASIHVGPLTPPAHRNRALVEVCRLVDSDAARGAMDAAQDSGVLLAAAVSDPVFRRSVAEARTPNLRKRQFLHAPARVKDKPGFEEPCWLFVPGLLPAAVRPYLPDDEPLAEPEPSSPPSGGAPDGGVKQKAKASGKARVVQVGGNYTTGEGRR